MKKMRKEVELWWHQAQDDFNAAQFNFEGGQY